MSWSARQRWSFRAIVIANTAVGAGGVIFTAQAIVLAMDRTGAGLLHSTPGILLTAGFWLCSLIGCWYGCLGLHQWLESRRILKRISSSQRQVMSALCRISEANRVVYGSQPLTLILAVIGLLAAWLLKEPRWLGVVIMALGLRWWLWVRTTTPPLVLFLSTSDAWSIEVHRQAKRLVSPVRVVTLLDLGNSPSSETADELLLDCLRTSNDDDWWKVITILIDLAPLVVINADSESPGVVREALHLISRDITFKTVFLTKGDPRLLRRAPQPAASASGCFVASAATLQGIIMAMLDNGKLPAQGRAVQSFVPVGGASNPSIRRHGGRTDSPPDPGRTQRSGNQLLLENAKCSQCNASMTIFLGVNRPGFFPGDVFTHESHQGCFRCAACGRYSCWDCSDSRKPCSCGVKSWQERQYFPAGVSPEDELRGLF